LDKPNNSRTVTVKITRRELVDLLVACATCSENVNDPANKWNKLHDKLREQLALFDLKN
jgi:hypothetical protein